MNHRPDMRVVEVLHVGGEGIQEGRRHRIGTLGAADDRRRFLAGEFRQNAKRDIHRLIPASRKGNRKEVEQRTLGLVAHLRRQIMPIGLERRRLPASSTRRRRPSETPPMPCLGAEHAAELFDLIRREHSGGMRPQHDRAASPSPQALPPHRRRRRGPCRRRRVRDWREAPRHMRRRAARISSPDLGSPGRT